jgi:hypothetical protein
MQLINPITSRELRHGLFATLCALAKCFELVVRCSRTKSREDMADPLPF